MWCASRRCWVVSEGWGHVNSEEDQVHSGGCGPPLSDYAYKSLASALGYREHLVSSRWSSACEFLLNLCDPSLHILHLTASSIFGGQFSALG